MQQKLLIFSSLSYSYIHHIYRSSLPSELWQPRPLAGPRKFSVWHNNTPLPRTVLCRHTPAVSGCGVSLITALPTIGSPRCSLFMSLLLGSSRFSSIKYFTEVRWPVAARAAAHRSSATLSLLKLVL